MNLLGYLTVSRLLGFESTLDERILLLVRQFAAERSGCRWCIERGRHDWRLARLPMILLRHLAEPESCGFFTQRDRAALAFAQAVAVNGCAGEIAELEFQRARQTFSDGEIAELARCMADHHLIEEPDS